MSCILPLYITIRVIHLIHRNMCVRSKGYDVMYDEHNLLILCVIYSTSIYHSRGCIININVCEVQVMWFCLNISSVVCEVSRRVSASLLVRYGCGHLICSG